ncbi:MULTISPECIES: DUF1816 domain-containing protein [unclassified Roseofilum]|uniref:DUF1816 domain-containing protein n=1 Tax=unclassified Roseofilum TaxID=2620099 RepID=UPI000E8FC2BE|nr:MULTISPECIES: DUF1816 domain-containing protein [unclassified Roseofilum]MBP0007244.1 DUF1816 domain-containing protein [Roseofilum sp. Belize Diploria]MBP0031887.1 DUF1816 domain-containing protein [Roseofilum sp. Belize BBD 4]HBQ99982.1 hypothetical protein [Cyanobacteria bacterium UBA11691]
MNNVQDLLVNTQNFLGFAYWIEIKTQTPSCTYYFGPFQSIEEAEEVQHGYEEDLKAEAAEGISTLIKQCKPEALTISGDLGEIGNRQEAIGNYRE